MGELTKGRYLDQNLTVLAELCVMKANYVSVKS